MSHLCERRALRVVQGQQRNDLWENLKTVAQRFPSDYFDSVYSCFALPISCPPQYNSYCSSITIVPFSLKRDIVHCEDNIQSVSSYPRISSQQRHTPRNNKTNNTEFNGFDFPEDRKGK